MLLITFWNLKHKSKFLISFLNIKFNLLRNSYSAVIKAIKSYYKTIKVEEVDI